MSAVEAPPGTVLIALEGAKNELTTALESKDLGSDRANIQTALKYIEMVLHSAREAQNEIDQRIAPS